MPARVASGAHHDREVAVLFLGQPLALALSGTPPGPETYHTVDMCGMPVLLMRDSAGKVRSFMNACRHAECASRTACVFPAVCGGDGRVTVPL